jgi:hypothetical protein
MTFNSRNARFKARNIDQSEQNINSFNQLVSENFTNQSIESSNLISDLTFSQTQRTKITDIVTAILRINRQNHSSLSASAVSSALTTTAFESRSDR